MGINEEYKQALLDLYENGMETEPRGMKVKELLTYRIVLDDPTDNVITIPGFETNVEYAEEELKWYYAGTNRIDWSPKIFKTWSKFSDDGNTVNSAYGHRIFGSHEDFCDQWEWVKNKLREDPDTRQAIMNVNYPADKKAPTKDFPCTIALQVFIRNEQLHWVTLMRSQDVYFGTRNDIYCFTKMQKRMAEELGIGLGKYYHVMNSFHIYERHFGKLEELFGGEERAKQLYLEGICEE